MSVAGSAVQLTSMKGRAERGLEACVAELALAVADRRGAGHRDCDRDGADQRDSGHRHSRERGQAAGEARGLTTPGLGAGAEDGRREQEEGDGDHRQLPDPFDGSGSGEREAGRGRAGEECLALDREPGERPANAGA